MARTRSITVALRSGVSEATLPNNVKMQANKSYAISLEDWGRISSVARTSILDEAVLNSKSAIVGEFDGTNFAKDLTSATFHNTVALPPIYSGSTTLEKLGATKYGLDGSVYKLVLLSSDGTLGNVNSTTTKNVAVWLNRSAFTVSVKTSAAGNADAEFAGVMVAATTAGRYGWMQIAGDVDNAAADAGVTAGDAVTVSRTSDGVFTSARGDESVVLDLTTAVNYGHVNEVQTVKFGVAAGAASDPQATSEVKILTVTGGVGPVNEVKILTVTGGAENDEFKLTVGGNDSAAIIMPAGGFANLTAATIDTALQGGTLGWADADVVVSGSNGGPFTLTFAAALAATDVGNMTVTNTTGAAAATVVDDGTGGSTQGVTAGKFKLAVGGNKSDFITMPAGGFANLTAAAIDTALAGGTLGWADASVVVSGSNGGPFTLTFADALANTNIGDMTVTDTSGSAAATVLDDGTGASVKGAADGGTFTLTFDGGPQGAGGHTTAAIPFNASEAQVQTAMDSVVDPGNSDVTKVGQGSYSIEFIGLLGGGSGSPDPAQLTSSGASLTGPNDPYTIAHATPTPGAASDDSFTLTLGGETTAAITYDSDATAANIQSELEGLTTIGAGNVTVAGSVDTGPWTITFTGDLSGEDVSALTINRTGFTGGTITTTAGGGSTDAAVGSALTTSSATKSDVAIRNATAVNLGRRERNLFLGRRA